MNHYHSNADGTMADAMPMFASIWLALFYVLRKNYYDHRASVESNVSNSANMERD